MFVISPYWRVGAAPAWWGQGRAALAACAGLLAEERESWALWLAVALAAGVLGYFALLSEPGPGWRWLPLPWLLAALLLARRWPLAGWLAGLGAAAALGFAVASWHAGRMPPALSPPRGPVLLQGQVAVVELLPDGRRITLERPRFDDGDALPRPVRVKLRRDDPARPQPGDAVAVRAMLRPPSAPAYPGAWDFQRAAWFGGPGAVGFALGRVELSPGEAPPLFAGLRARIEARVTALLPGAQGAVAVALLTGSQGVIPAADMQAMRDSGLAHILSVSGLHIMIVMGVAFGLLRLAVAAWPWLALRLPGKAVAAVAALGVGGAYMLLTGAQVPMQRSFAMAALATLAILAGRRPLSLRAWALAMAAVLLVQPDALLGPSFQMSFAAVLALIAGFDALRPWLRRLREKGGWWRRGLLLLVGMAGTSVLAGLATTPFGLFHFGRLQLYGVAANALAVPITSFVVMPAGMAALALMPLGLEAWALGPMGWGVEAILQVARWVASWPGAAMSLPPLPPSGLLLVSLGMAWLCLWRLRWRLLGLGLILAGLGTPWLVRPPDMLVSADARLIAWHDGATVHLQRATGAPNFTRDQWLRLWGVAEARAFPATAHQGAPDCTPGACRIGGVVLLRGDTPAAHCGHAALVISAEPLRARCPGSQVIDRFTVWRDGAHAIWLEGQGARTLSDRAARGDRPWVPPPPQPRRRVPAGSILPPVEEPVSTSAADQ